MVLDEKTWNVYNGTSTVEETEKNTIKIKEKSIKDG
jgi:hypothetical protein